AMRRPSAASLPPASPARPSRRLAGNLGCAAAVAAALLVLAACGADDPVVDDPLPPPDPADGFQVSMEADVPAGAELWQCKVSEIPTVEFTPVNYVESVQTAGVHHMDVMALAFANVDLAPGTYECADLYRDYPQLMEDGLIIYAAQQAEQHIKLPEGTIANLPGSLKIMQELHYVNATNVDAHAFSKINIYRYTGTADQQIWGGAVRDTNLNIPPGESTEWTRCVMSDDVDVLFLSSHTHALGVNFEIRAFDGTDVGELLYSNSDWATPSLLSFDEQPLHVPAGQGFEFSCHFDNLTDQTVHWGFSAAEEMCQIAYVFTPGFADHKCNVVETSDGVLP
ncbi:MAG: hypothetical protein KC464_32725, partial [Myxococcales bacterium]|nr:hypothetical protein [Myxococcales bacterium]